MPWRTFALTVTRRDQIGHAAALEEGGQLAAGVEDIHEANHLHEAQPDDSRLGVVAQLEAINEASAAGHDVLEGTANLHGISIVHDHHAEVVRLEQIAQNLAILLVRAADCRFAEVALSHLVGQVGAHQHGAWDLRWKVTSGLDILAVSPLRR